MSVAAATPMADPDPTRAEIGARVRSGLGWKMISESIRLLSRTGVAIILARTLGPHDFGIAGMALILSSFVISFADLGLGGAIVQAKTVTEVGLSTVFWTSIAAGAALTILGIASAGAVAWFFHEPRVEPLVMVLSLTFVLTSLGSTHRSLMARAMDFRNLEIRFLIGVLAGAVAGVAAALAGLGPWALIIQEVALAAVSTALLWLLMPWRPRWAFSASDLRSLGGYGFRSVGGFLFVGLNQNADNVLVGKFLGAAALGIYSLAYSAILLPLTRIVTPVQQVLFPAFSRLQGDRRAMSDAWLRTLRMVAAFVAPMMLGLILCAHELIPAVFGPKWIPAIRVVQVLAVASIVQCIVTMNSTVLLATGAARSYMWISAATFLVNLVAFIVGLHWGVLGVATAYTISSTALAVGYTALTARALDVGLARVPRILGRVAEANLGMVAVTFGVKLLVSHRAGSTVELSAAIASGILSYAVFLYWREASLFGEVWRLIRGRLGTIARDGEPQHATSPA